MVGDKLVHRDMEVVRLFWKSDRNLVVIQGLEELKELQGLDHEELLELQFDY